MQGTALGFSENADAEEELCDVGWIPIMFQTSV